jgi:HPt (histidine-containing phosphotransfer) domain-containing protein
MEDLQQLFLQVAPERLQKMRAAAAGGDCASLKLEAQRLRASAERIAAIPLAEFSRRVEEAADRADASAARTQIPAIESELARVSQHLGQEAHIA